MDAQPDNSGACLRWMIFRAIRAGVLTTAEGHQATFRDLWRIAIPSRLQSPPETPAAAKKKIEKCSQAEQQQRCAGVLLCLHNLLTGSKVRPKLTG